MCVCFFLGSLAEWLKVHPQYLGSVMNYIVPCLSDPQLAPSASSAFADICDTCRNSLVNELNSLMHVYAAMSNSNIKVLKLFSDRTVLFIDFCIV